MFQEDKPAETARILAEFAARNRFGLPIVPIKSLVKRPGGGTPAPGAGHNAFGMPGPVLHPSGDMPLPRPPGPGSPSQGR
mgnify:CR=1 FL=1